MSRTVKHIGRVQIITKTTENTKRYLLEHPIEGIGYEEEDGYTSWENESDEYILLDSPKKEVCLVKFVEHKELDEYEDINYKRINSDDTISFITEYYNGCCWLGDALEDLLEEELNSE